MLEIAIGFGFTPRKEAVYHTNQDILWNLEQTRVVHVRSWDEHSTLVLQSTSLVISQVAIALLFAEPYGGYNIESDLDCA